MSTADKAPFSVTRHNWWEQVGTLPAFCKPLRTAFSVYLEPGYYSAWISPGELNRIIQEVGPFVLLDGEKLFIVRKNERIHLSPDPGLAPRRR